VLILGAGEAASVLAEELQSHFPDEYLIVGFVEDGHSSPEVGEEVILGGRQQIGELVDLHQIDQVMIADFLTGSLGGSRGSSSSAGGAAPAVLGSPERDNGEKHYTAAESRPAWSAPMKRGFDILLSVVALVLGAPAAVLAAFAVKLTSPGPVLYRQERIGRNGQPFTIYKLRTMIDGAENGTGPILAQGNDPRKTRVGGILRATKLDEWPQFFNVLKGDMSVVGPRPERLCFVDTFSRHIPEYSRRHSVRPGITGLAQVRGGYLTHVYVKLHYDLIYVSKQSFWLDLWTVCETPVTIVQGLVGRQ
jgi:lipopolysaccharide/colanic/teichoic acid biosynthesis glycosyltransferase